MRHLPKWRKMTWVVLVFNALMLLWVTVGINDRPSKDCATDPAVVAGTMSLDTCQAASDVGTGLGVALVGVLWFLGFIVLSLIWLMSRPRRQEVIVVHQAPQS
jgi:hypothetical protein